MFNAVLRALPLLVAALAVAPAHAAVWAVNNTAPATNCDTVSNVSPESSCKVRGTNDVTATAYGYANTGSIVAGTGNASSRRWATATLTDQGSSGIGVNHGQTGQDPGEGGNPEHAIDGDGRNDAVVFSFSTSTVLKKLKLGWVGSDSDLVVMYWSGAAAPTMSNYHLSSNTTGAATTNMVATGAWSMLGRYANVSTTELNLQNTANEGSGWWLVTAYNNAFASADIKNGSSDQFGQGNDYFKLLSVSGDAEVPVPGTLALGLLGLAAIGGLRRKQRSR
jgi:MYXO-CTERM domain-containing protein